MPDAINAATSTAATPASAPSPAPTPAATPSAAPTPTPSANASEQQEFGTSAFRAARKAYEAKMAAGETGDKPVEAVPGQPTAQPKPPAKALAIGGKEYDEARLLKIFEAAGGDLEALEDGVKNRNELFAALQSKLTKKQQEAAEAIRKSQAKMAAAEAMIAEARAAREQPTGEKPPAVRGVEQPPAEGFFPKELLEDGVFGPLAQALAKMHSAYETKLTALEKTIQSGGPLYQPQLKAAIGQLTRQYGDRTIRSAVNAIGSKYGVKLGPDGTPDLSTVEPSVALDVLRDFGEYGAQTEEFTKVFETTLSESAKKYGFADRDPEIKEMVLDRVRSLCLDDDAHDIGVTPERIEQHFRTLARKFKVAEVADAQKRADLRQGAGTPIVSSGAAAGAPTATLTEPIDIPLKPNGQADFKAARERVTDARRKAGLSA